MAARTLDPRRGGGDHPPAAWSADRQTQAIREKAELFAKGVSGELLGGDRPAAIQSRRIRHMSPSENAGYAPGAVMRFEIPTAPNTFLVTDTTLDLTVRTDANNHVFDGSIGAGSIIERIRVFSGSQLLTDTSHYAKLANLITDVSKSYTATGTSGATCYLGPNEYSTAELAAATTIVPYQDAATSLFNGAGDQAVSIPLMDGIIGSLAGNKAFPLHACSAAPLRVEITLASNAAGIQGQGGAVNWTVVNQPYLRCTIVEVSDRAMELIDDTTPSPVFNTVGYASSTSSPTANQTSNTVNLPFSYTSIKHLLTGYYMTANEADQLTGSQSARATGGAAVAFPNLNGSDECYWTIGASRVPSQPLQGGAQMAVSAQECFSLTTHLTQASNHLQPTSWNRGGAVCDGVLKARAGTRAYCLDCETMGPASQFIESGINTTNAAVSVTVAWAAAVANPMTVYSWAGYDLRVDFANGVAFARY